MRLFPTEANRSIERVVWLDATRIRIEPCVSNDNLRIRTRIKLVQGVFFGLDFWMNMDTPMWRSQ